MANESLVKTLAEEQNDRIQFVKIRLGTEWYGISIGIVENIVKMQRITRVPGAESYIKGVINLRGKVVPVMSLRLKMGMDEGETVRTTRIIILRIVLFLLMFSFFVYDS